MKVLLLLLLAAQHAESFMGLSGALPLSSSALQLRSRASHRQSSASVCRVVSEMDKVEVKAVERLVKQYDKLCKTCPTRLQPRLDNVAHMMLSLPEDERLQVMSQVKKSLKEGSADGNGLIDVKAVSQGMSMGQMKQESKEMDVPKPEMKPEKEMQMGQDKMAKKMRKLQEKIDKNMMKMMDREAKLKLLEEFKQGNKEMPAEEGLVKEWKMLQEMSPERIEVRRLKLIEKKAKCERKVAECSLDLKELQACAEPRPVASPVC
mmetsp:Transcript_20982/g.32884  ORF Transcript_20982/g.32884 Transcript_20982/m.32884 type:complete len:263 (-) Transcript_20982:78-866(-)